MNYKLPFIGKLAFALVSVTILIYWLMVLQDILVPVFISIILSMSIFPICNWLENRKLGRIWAVIITLILFSIVALGVIWLASTQVADFGEMLPQLQKRFTIWSDQIQRWAENTFHVGRKTQIAQLRKYGTGMLSTGGTFFTTALSTTGNVLGNLLLIPIYMFFFLYYRDFFKMFFYKVFSNDNRKKIDSVLTKIYEVIHSY